MNIIISETCAELLLKALDKPEEIGHSDQIILGQFTRMLENRLAREKKKPIEERLSGNSKELEDKYPEKLRHRITIKRPEDITEGIPSHLIPEERLKGQRAWKVDYYYLATGMEGIADRHSEGIFTGRTKEEAINQCLEKNYSGRSDPEKAWIRSCLTVIPI